MDVPYLQIEQYQAEDDRAKPDFSEYAWQSLFACQVEVRPHLEWAKLKWGFNASALFDEAIVRQKLFLESQYIIRDQLRTEHPDRRTLAFRYVSRPGNGLVLTVLGKIHARTKEEVVENATALFRELKSTFPYDYNLVPACSQDEFLRISGLDILDDKEGLSDLAQIKRSETPILWNHRSLILQGLWQSDPHAHEQIWRSLAASPNPLLMNISIRSTLLYPGELERLSKNASDSSETGNNFAKEETFQTMKHWNELYIKRRVTPWKKFFYLQIHLASTRRIDENLFRIAGTSLTVGGEKNLTLGYQVVAPPSDKQLDWRRKLRNLDLVSSVSQLPVPRLAELADLDEVFAVVRLPYEPPDNGFPDVKFATAKNV